MSKRILSTITLLTVMLSLCVFCLPASAQKTVWDGAEVKPTADSDQDGFIDITLPSHLAWVVANDGNGGEKYELLNDIWLNDITVNTESGTYTNNGNSSLKSWYTCGVGAGGASATFEGTIAGNGYTVHGLFYDDETEETELTSPGLIPFPKTLTVTDLKIDNSFIKKTGGSTVAAFSGRTHQITATYLRCMVGENVYIEGGPAAAGFAGGGGKNSYVTITDCVSLATVTATSKAAGIAGDIWNSTGWKINNCYTTSSRLVGSTKVLSNSKNLYSASGCNNSTALTTVQMSGQNAKTNMAFDFENVWIATAGYPIPRVFFDGSSLVDITLIGDDMLLTPSYKGSDTPTSLGVEIDGTEYTVSGQGYTLDAKADSVYSIRPFAVVGGEKIFGDTQKACAAVLANIAYNTADELEKAELDQLFKNSKIYKSGVWQTDGVITKQPTADADNDGYIDITLPSELAWVVANNGNSGGKYELLNDIVLNDITVDAKCGTYTANTALEPNPWYTRSTSTFVGELKGNGHIVRGIFYDDDTTYFNDELRVAGGLIPYPKNAVVSGVGVEDSYMKILSNYSVGAIAGCVHGNSIKLKIDECYAGKSVYAESYTAPGGILGGGGAKTSGYVKINNCYSLATLRFGREYHGGIIGNNWSPANYSLTNCFCTGPIVSNNGALTSYTAFENLYSSGIDTRGGATVLLDADMRGYNAALSMSGLDFENIWVTTEDYPTLRVFDPELRASNFGITDVSLDTDNGIRLSLRHSGTEQDGVSFGISINGNNTPISLPNGEHFIDAAADTVYTVRAYSEKDGNRVYDKTYTLCAAVSANVLYNTLDETNRGILDTLFKDSEIYNGADNSTLTFSLFSDFHYIQDGYISTIADIDAMLRRAKDNNAAFIMSAGDFCNNYAGSPELFKAYLDNEYDMPAYNVYGNHELQTEGNTMATVTPKLTNDENVVWGTADGKIGDGSIGYYYFDKDGFRIVAIDTQYSYEPQTGEWEHNKGGSTSPESDNSHTEALGPVQLAWLEKVLLDAADKDMSCIVVGHDGMSGMLATGTSSSDAAAVRAIFAKANAQKPGTVLMCINGHLHTNHQVYNEGVFYLDMNTVRNCLWSSGGTAHYTDGQTFMYENYDDEGNLIETVEKNVNEISGSTKTWYSKDPLNAVVTVSKSGVITIDGVESEWLYGVDPNSTQTGVEPRVSSGTYFDCSATGHIYKVTGDTEEHTITCKNTLCDYKATAEHTGGTATCTKKAVCEICLAEYGSVSDHSFTTKASNSQATPADCDNAATYFVQCDNCDAVHSTMTVVVGEKNGHAFNQKDSGQKADDATCKAPQKNYVQCDNCNAISTDKTTNVGDVVDHKFENYVSDNNATCCDDGTKTAKCKWCDEKDTVADANTAKGHGDTTKVFKDVAAGKWYVNAINYNYTHKFISGMKTDEFGVNTEVTRGMFITILARIAGVDTSNNKVTTKFTDVESGKYFTAAIKWASENKIVNGMTATTFAPNAPIQRQQLCVMIVNFAKYQKIELTASEKAISFKDAAAIGNYAKDAVATCQMADIVNGYANGDGFDFKPTNTATRAEAAQILYKFHKDFVA